MTAKKDMLTKPSEPEKVDAYMAKLTHPLADVVAALRKIILSTDRNIGEEIKWNAPAFFYTGELPPFNPKEHKRHIVVFQLLQAGLHSSGLPKRRKGAGQIWSAGGRLSRRAQNSPVSRHERGRIAKDNLAGSHQTVACHPG